MKILCSACLIGENCKYNGGNNYSAALAEYIEFLQSTAEGDGTSVEIIPVCPEVLGGLPTPRVPAEIVNGIVRTETGTSVDKEFRLGAAKALHIGLAEKVDLAVLQSRSPSCGPKEVYDGTFSGTLKAGAGIFAQQLRQAGIRTIDIEDLASINL
ncbi:DUF523 domain-containing protein [uncultured Veillonella sp.]|uniref:DUF523 domain-containing protein n=1 Tax=uncultured Veillonella sp. TaxID=159268 RepID=UPI0026350F1E|nr:DUF523 domain-containing protein [uncultured Veillonella sp.]